MTEPSEDDDPAAMEREIDRFIAMLPFLEHRPRDHIAQLVRYCRTAPKWNDKPL